MKILPGILLCSFSALCLLSNAHGESAKEIFARAQAAYLKGDIESAQRDFEMVYQLDPQNAAAVTYLRRIKASGVPANITAKARRQKELAAVIIPKVDFREATLGTALEFLKQQAAKASPNIAAVSFVLADEQLKLAPVTLSLSQVPLTEVLRYLGEMTNSTVVYDQYAIVLRLKNVPQTVAAGASTAAPTAAPAEPAGR